MASFASMLVISYHFGTSAELDAYWVAFALMNLLAFPLAPLREALIPEFHRHLRRDPAVAADYFSRAMTLILLVASAGALLGWMLAEPLTTVAVSGKQQEVRTLAVAQIYWLAPVVILLAVSETMNAMLTAFNRVVLQGFARLLGAVATLAVLGAFAGILHEHVLPAALVAAQLATSMVQLGAMRRHGLRFRFAWPGMLGKRFAAVSGALGISFGASQIYAVSEKHVLTFLSAGLVSSFQYAVSLTNALVTLVGVTLASVLWPRFLGHAATEDREKLLADVSVVSRLIFLGMGWLCALTWLNAEALVKLIFARGAFDAADVARTAHALRIAVFAAVPIAIVLVTGRAMISLGAARGVLATGLTTALGGGGTLALGALLQSPSLAMSHWLVGNLAGLATQATFLMRACRPSRGIPRSFLWWIARWLVVLMAAGVVAQVVPSAAHSDYLPLIENLVLRSAVFTILFASLGWVLGLARGLRSPLRA